MRLNSLYSDGHFSTIAARACVAAAVFLACAAVGKFAYAEEEEKPAVAEAEEITLTTKDFVQLKCTWYAGSLGKKSPAVILVHGWEGQRSDFESLALALQKRGCAVIVPDLRGHGGSTRQKEPGQDERIIKRESLKPSDLQDMVSKDIEACKKFLRDKNNAGELNIELLCVVGVELGGMLAVDYAALDYSWDQLPAFKIGRDVKALVLISPLFAYRGLTIQRSLTNPTVQKDLSLMFLYGAKDSRAASDVKRIHATVAKFHPIPKDKEEQRKKQDLFLIELDTSLPGSKMIKEESLGIADKIAGFIALRLTAKQEDYPWADRPSPTGD